MIHQNENKPGNTLLFISININNFNSIDPIFRAKWTEKVFTYFDVSFHSIHHSLDDLCSIWNHFKSILL